MAATLMSPRSTIPMMNIRRRFRDWLMSPSICTCPGQAQWVTSFSALATPGLRGAWVYSKDPTP